jgi:hypothetical protein
MRVVIKTTFITCIQERWAMKALTRLFQWPVVYLMLALVLDDKWSAVAFTLALVFRNDLSAVLQRRRLIVRWKGFRCRLDGDTNPPGGTDRNPPRFKQ